MKVIAPYPKLNVMVADELHGIAHCPPEDYSVDHVSVVHGSLPTLIDKPTVREEREQSRHLHSRGKFGSTHTRSRSPTSWYGPYNPGVPLRRLIFSRANPQPSSVTLTRLKA